MPHSSPATRRRQSHSSRPSRGRNRPPRRSRILRLALLASALAFGSIVTVAYFAFHDDVFAGLLGRQAEKQVAYEAQIADLRAQIERIGRLDQERVEQQVKTVLQRQATLEQVSSGLANELSVQARNGLPASGSLASPPLLSPSEKPASPIVAIPQEKEEKEAKQVAIGHKKAHRPHRKHARAFRKRTQKPPTIGAGGHNAYAGPEGQRDY